MFWKRGKPHKRTSHMPHRQCSRGAHSTMQYAHPAPGAYFFRQRRGGHTVGGHTFWGSEWNTEHVALWDVPRTQTHESDSEARNPIRTTVLQKCIFWEILTKFAHPCAVRCSSRRVCPQMLFPGLQHASRVNSNTSGAYSPHFYHTVTTGSLLYPCATGHLDWDC